MAPSGRMGLLARWGRSRQQAYDEMVDEERQLARDPRKRRKQAVEVLAAVAVLALVLLATVLLSAQREQPLRAGGLPTAEAEVVRYDYVRRGTDEAEVRYEAAGAVLEAEIPTSERFRRGDRVLVAYDPAEPSHVRLVQGWEPWYASTAAAMHGGLLAVLAAVAVVSGLTAHQQVRRGVSPAG